ncbi:MAG TPA: M20/M25/M40 family metallo-hydrolase [Gammaproteobacteria bacterium]|nr:M20/M25/M40 family metallo-hydrolase [Gammaproteobacteria bacterium]
MHGTRTLRRTIERLGASAAGAVALIGSAAAVEPVGDWDAIAGESLAHFESLIRIDTSNPPGNETEVAEYLRDVLAAAEISVELYALEPERANIVARLPGNGSKEPILIMAHTDVVGVQAEKWSVDAFSAIERDGYIYGRGTLDDKDSVTAGLMTMLLLKRSGLALDRDVIFLAEAGEEGTTHVGVDFMVERHWDAIAAEYCLAEGGGAVARDGEVRYMSIATTEKFPMRIRLLARGTAGHGSVPRIDNAVGALAAAVTRLYAWQTPMRFNATTTTYFDRLASISEPEDAARYRGLLDPGRRLEVERYLAEHEPQHYSLLRTSVVPTMMSAGFRRNVIPSEAEATFDIRALPDENPAAFYAEIGRIVADPSVEVVREPVYRPASAPSRIDNEMFAALERVTEQLYPGAITMPTMLTGATDMAQIRAQGTQCYGLGPVREEADIASGGGAHGDDERIQIASVPGLVQYFWYAVTEVAAAP